MKTCLRLFINFKNAKSLFKDVSCRIRLILFLSTILLCGNLAVNAQTISNVIITGTPVCAGSTVTVNFNVTNGNGNYFNNATSYQAYISNAIGGSFTTIGAAFTISSSNYTTIYNSLPIGLSTTITIPAGTVTGTGYKISIGSSNPTYVASAGENSSAGFSVNAQVTPTVSIAANPGTTICAGTNVIFTATPTNGGISPSYQWYIGGSAVNGQTGSTFTASTLTNGNVVSVVMTTSALCPTSITATSNSITMTVNPVLVPSVSILASQTTFCVGSSVTFNINSIINGGTNPGYLWLLNGNTIPGAITSSYSNSSLANNDIINLQITTNAVCASPVTALSNNVQVTVNPNATIVLTSGGGTNNQSVCQNAAMTPITFAVSGGGNGATVTGLPTGVSGTYSGGIVTISGTPSAAGPFNYIVNTTGSCAQITATGTITVTPIAAINLTSANNTQTRCINVAIANITYTVSGGGTGAGVTGLPAGVTGSFSGGTLTISGAPTATGTFNYTVATTGTCSQVTATGSITVNPNATLTLTSAPPTINQTLCILTTITPITYSVSGATTMNATGLPPGVTATVNSGLITISGSPSNTLTTTYNYTVTTTGSCLNASLSGTIRVYAGNPAGWTGSTAITISPSRSICPPAIITLSVPAATNSEYYNWVLPSGWFIISGAQTNSIQVSVTTAAATNNQIVTVQAINSCGTISTSTAANGNNAINVNSFTGVTVNQTTQSVCNNKPNNSPCLMCCMGY